MKKAQGLPITTIIIAALGIVVLVILFAFVTGRLGLLGGELSKCPGVCSGEYQLVGGVKRALGPDRACDPNFERELSGVFIKSNQPSNLRSDDVVRCERCCQPLIST